MSLQRHASVSQRDGARATVLQLRQSEIEAVDIYHCLAFASDGRLVSERRDRWNQTSVITAGVQLKNGWQLNGQSPKRPGHGTASLQKILLHALSMASLDLAGSPVFAASPRLTADPNPNLLGSTAGDMAMTANHHVSASARKHLRQAAAPPPRSPLLRSPDMRLTFLEEGLRRPLSPPMSRPCRFQAARARSSAG